MYYFDEITSRDFSTCEVFKKANVILNAREVLGVIRKVAMPSIALRIVKNTILSLQE